MTVLQNNILQSQAQDHWKPAPRSDRWAPGKPHVSGKVFLKVHMTKWNGTTTTIHDNSKYGTIDSRILHWTWHERLFILLVSFPISAGDIPLGLIPSTGRLADVFQTKVLKHRQNPLEQRIFWEHRAVTLLVSSMARTLRPKNWQCRQITAAAVLSGYGEH